MEEIDSKIEFLTAPANLILTGATGSGKTYFLLKLLTIWPFEQKMGKIIYFYSAWQDLFEKYIEQFPTIEFIQGLSLEKLDTWEKEENIVNVVVTDDLMQSAVKNEEFSRLFTVLSHHKNILNFFLTQNLFLHGPLATTLSRNCHYIFIMKTPHLNMLSTLGTQLFGRGDFLKEVYLRVMKERPYNYLLVDVFSNDQKNRLRSNILMEESLPIAIWRSM